MLYDGILKPGRYIGVEWNASHKEWDSGTLKVALCFPDIYEIGMSHLGAKIIYGILNNEKDVLCERVFAPWSDMEQKMRSAGEPLVSLETKKALKEFDMIGFSLQYELGYVDVLNMLEMGNVPVFSKERSDDDPIVIAGGPCAFNPEPMADFIDAFVIGEAEEVILEITNIAHSSWLIAHRNREEFLKQISKIDGVYVPNYVIASPKDEAISEIASSSAFGGTPRNDIIIKKRIVKDLNNAYFPTSPVVPYIQTVHDRIAIEIMRGCPHRCKFCQACRIFHPLRLRSVERVLEIAEESVRATGYGEISLLSLSTGDYPYMEELAARLEERFRHRGVKVSFPSLSVKSFDSHDGKAVLKRAGLTFAPEAGSERLRKLLNKKITNEEVIQKSRLALGSGWRKVKLYFMIGLPGETDGDLDAIIDLASRIKNVNLSISSFIPKPHSEFEREAMAGLDELMEKQRYLGSRLKDGGSKRYIRMDCHDARMSRIEAVLSRGDRKTGQVIYMAWQGGARLQSWKDYFAYKIWDECFEKSGIEPGDYLKKANSDDPLPWGFIKT